MADSKAIGRWLISHRQDLNLQVDRLTWIKDWLPEQNHFNVEISLDGASATGSGIDEIADMAFVKAGAEAIERLICAQNQIRSSGVAAHIDDKMAQENAAHELLERDAFLCHYLTKTPFIRSQANKNSMYQKIVQKLGPLGVSFQVVKMKTPKNHFLPLLAWDFLTVKKRPSINLC